MKLFLSAAAVIALGVLPVIGWSQLCTATIRDHVEVAGSVFSAADLLDSNSCPALVRAAAGVRLGAVPLVGSPRVFRGDDLRSLLQSVAVRAAAGFTVLSLQVPERVTLRRAGPRATCIDIAQRVQLASNPFLPVLDCGAADRIPEDTKLELSRKAWNPVLGNWQAVARCADSAECVPFLVRVPGLPGEALHDTQTAPGAARQQSAPPAPSKQGAVDLLVRPGETVSLLWDQHGIRLVIPAVALEAGGSGELVRARIARGGRVVRAVVTGAGKLRTAS